ncbi:MAG: hypothetical protein LBL82_02150 [Oscillospiraceae bacterium]|jgi:glycerophosphoryl diester phosphodiesterase|nr:hypothetical protein [Oscillospiraceae bacterium]
MFSNTKLPSWFIVLIRIIALIISVLTGFIEENTDSVAVSASHSSPLYDTAYVISDNPISVKRAVCTRYKDIPSETGGDTYDDYISLDIYNNSGMDISEINFSITAFSADGQVVMNTENCRDYFYTNISGVIPTYSNEAVIISPKKYSSAEIFYVWAEKIVFSDGIEWLREELSPPLATVFVQYQKVKYIGHRGLAGLAPENTIPSFSLAGSYGIWGAECDLRETADGHFVICHDSTVNRTTDGTGSVSEKTLGEIKALTIDSKEFENTSDYKDLKIPTLDEYLQCLGDFGVTPVIEIKTMSADSAKKLVDILRKFDVENTASIISFDHDILDAIRDISSVNMQYLFNEKTLSESNYHSQIYALKSVKNADISIHYTTATREIIEYAHRNGIKVNVWSINDKAAADALIDIGVDFISSDFPPNDSEGEGEDADTGSFLMGRLAEE